MTLAIHIDVYGKNDTQRGIDCAKMLLRVVDKLLDFGFDHCEGMELRLDGSLYGLVEVTP